MSDEGIIKVLDDNTINRIAAGEVVERPAAVVKELLENAIDAGSTRIRIDLERGGIELIRIRDNGMGMSRKDALCSLQRHATSKIRSDTDLFTVLTLGFRGEAIPSIASISRFEILTRRQDDDIGTRITVEGGEIVDVEDAGAPAGTQITVRNLFFNVPARRKFLRQESTELSHCCAAVIQELLIRPELELQLFHKNSALIRAPRVETMLLRAKSLLKREASSLISVDARDEHARIYGLISPVGIHHTGTKNSYLYVNGRFVKDTAMRRAISEAYQGLVPKGRYPTIVLCLEVPTEQVDVNVHPAKIEVRFRNVRSISHLITTGLRSALQKQGIQTELPRTDHRPVLSLSTVLQRTDTLGSKQLSLVSKPSAEPVEALRQHLTQQPMSNNNKEAIASNDTENFVAAEPKENPFLVSHHRSVNEFYGLDKEVNKERIDALSNVEAPSPKQELDPRVFPQQQHWNPQKVLGRPIGWEHKASIEVVIPPSNPKDEAAFLWPAYKGTDEEMQMHPLLPVPQFSDLKVIGQHHLTYILCEGNGELVIIDQHAAHERINLYRLQQNKADRLGGFQRLLTPVVIELTPQRFHAILPKLDLIEPYGFECEQFGESVLLLRQVPVAFMNEDHQSLFEALADNFMEGGSGEPLIQRIELFLATRACHSSIRAGDHLSIFEIKELLEDLDGVDFGVCAHGRPVAIRIAPTELERRFHRS